MARRKSNTSATGANMDSLLDALTNVVGILVIVLVAVQLSSQEAARRMEEMIAQIDPAEQERIKQAAKDSEAKLEEMKLALQTESDKEKMDPEKLLAMLQDDIAAAELKAKKDLLAAEAAEKEAEEKKLAAETICHRSFGGAGQTTDWPSKQYSSDCFSASSRPGRVNRGSHKNKQIIFLVEPCR